MEFFLLGWHPDYLDSSNFLAPWITESPQSQGTYFHLHPNYQAYVNIMDVALGSTDKAVRTKMFEAFQILSTQDVPWIPMWSMTDEMVLATRTNVRGHFMDLTMECLTYLIYKVEE
jgi:peptide/nickel transport system substrate-binding protein